MLFAGNVSCQRDCKMLLENIIDNTEKKRYASKRCVCRLHHAASGRGETAESSQCQRRCGRRRRHRCRSVTLATVGRLALTFEVAAVFNQAVGVVWQPADSRWLRSHPVQMTTAAGVTSQQKNATRYQLVRGRNAPQQSRAVAPHHALQHEAYARTQHRVPCARLN